MVNSVGPHSLKPKEVRQQHYEKITKSTNFMGRLWHAIVFGVETVIPFVAVLEAIVRNNWNRNSEPTQIGTKVKPLSQREVKPLREVVPAPPSRLSEALTDFVKIAREVVEGKSNEDYFSLFERLSEECKIIVRANVSDIEKIDTKEIKEISKIFKTFQHDDRISGFFLNAIIGLILKVCLHFENIEAFDKELNKNPVPSLIDNKDLLSKYFGENGFSLRALEEFAKLSSNNLKLFLTKFVEGSECRELWYFVHYTIEFLQMGTQLESEQRIKEFFRDSSITSDDFSQISGLAKALYKIQQSNSSVENASSPTHQSLVHTSPGLPAAVGDQALYQERFIETYIQASKKIKTESFDDILDYIASQRHEMAISSEGEGNPFGIKRVDPYFHSLQTNMVESYKKYRDLFLDSDKKKWKKHFDNGVLSYQMEVTPNGKQSPLILTRIDIRTIYGTYDSTSVATWFHTPVENIQQVLEEASRLFNKVRELKVAHDPEGLEVMMKAVGELHWWLAQASPYQRGSAAIAKMMIYAILNYHGIEPGGFSDIEPDCIALIQDPTEFIDNYSKLMVRPPPHWI